MMGRRGRFGKYGETKRLERLRKTKHGTEYMKKGGRAPFGGPLQHKKKASRETRIDISPADTSDVSYIQGLSKKVFEKYGPYEDLLRDWFESGMAKTYMAIRGRRQVGFAMVGRVQMERFFPPAFELLAIAVEPSMRRRGVGDLLMTEAERMVVEMRGEMLILHTAVENREAQRLFKKHGFVIAEIRRGFYPRGQDAYSMYRHLL
jgi:ribosomal protein S18 acetylase RimI-like enzyme